jgi:hypothetical protein
VILDFDLTYYLSGPMTGKPQYNYPMFKTVSERLRKFGLKVVSPHEIPPPSGTFTDEELWQYYMDRCWEQMDQCHALVQLPGWVHSRGARAEFQRAIDSGWKHFYFYKENPGVLIPLHH